VSAHLLPKLTAAIRLVAHEAMRTVFRPTLALTLHRAPGHELREESRLVLLAWGHEQCQQLAPAFGP
jgi:hypothetical protein